MLRSKHMKDQQVAQAVQAALDAGKTRPWGVCVDCIVLLAGVRSMNTTITTPLKPDDRIYREVTMAGLKASASSGCGLCRINYLSLEEMLASNDEPGRASLERMLPSWARHLPRTESRLVVLSFLQNVPASASLLHFGWRLLKGPNNAWPPLKIRLAFARTRQGSLVFKHVFPLHAQLSPSSSPGHVLDKDESPQFWEHFTEMELKYMLYPENDEDVSAAYLPLSPINLDVGGEAAMEQINAWLDDCISTCPDCSPKDSSTALPGLLLCVSHDSYNVDEDIVLGAGEARLEYIALSYCWGVAEQPEATTLANVDARCRGFSSRYLPQTILDAIRVARCTGYDFLWVDSLCIVQDCAEDKKTEISKMKSIFERAAMTIVASSASKVTDGFLGKREGYVTDRVDGIPFWDEEGQVGRTNLLRTRVEDFFLSKPPKEFEPLQCRAWTLEEWVLSRRRVIFPQGQVAWKCRSFTAQDGGADEPTLPPGMEDRWDIPQDVLSDSSSGPIDETKTSESVLASKGKKFAKYWEGVLREYTLRTLTHETDRLVAIDGIAQRISQSTGWKYTVGIWDESTHFWLCWHQKSDIRIASTPTRKIQNLSCPTWSWGSNTAQLGHPGMWNRRAATCIGTVEMATSDLTPLYVLNVETPLVDIGPLTPWLDETLWPNEQAFNFELERHAEHYRTTFLITAGRNLKTTTRMFPDTQDIVLRLKFPLKFLPLMHFGSVFGLILAPTENGKMDYFERVGYMECEDDARGNPDKHECNEILSFLERVATQHITVV